MEIRIAGISGEKAFFKKLAWWARGKAESTFTYHLRAW
jgi:hypothetical protein